MCFISGIMDSLSCIGFTFHAQEDEVQVNHKKKVIVLGSGPIRIGQGVEFDYCSVHSVWALRKMGIEAIIINNNPETVSTDFDISDRLYFEPLTTEDVLNIIDKEQPDGVIVQFGGQTAINLAASLKLLALKSSVLPLMILTALKTVNVLMKYWNRLILLDHKVLV